MSYNIELFELIKTAVRQEPERMNIWTWQERVFEPRWPASSTSHGGQLVPPVCNTVGCIAGWAVLLTDAGVKRPEDLDPVKLRETPLRENEWQERGADALGISTAEALTLFSPDNWPSDLQSELSKTQYQTPEHAEVVCDAIDRFLENPTAFVEENGVPEEFLDEDDDYGSPTDDRGSYYETP